MTLSKTVGGCAMTIRPVVLDPVVAVECGELLEFVARWLSGDAFYLAASLGRFVDGAGYDINELRADLSGFAALFGAGADDELDAVGER